MPTTWRAGGAPWSGAEKDPIDQGTQYVFSDRSITPRADLDPQARRYIRKALVRNRSRYGAIRASRPSSHAAIWSGVVVARTVRRARENSSSRCELNASITAQAEVCPTVATARRIRLQWKPWGYAKLGTSWPSSSSSMCLEWLSSSATSFVGMVSSWRWVCVWAPISTFESSSSASCDQSSMGVGGMAISVGRGPRPRNAPVVTYRVLGIWCRPKTAAASAKSLKPSSKVMTTGRGGIGDWSRSAAHRRDTVIAFRPLLATKSTWCANAAGVTV